MKNLLLSCCLTFVSLNAMALNLECSGFLTFQSGTNDAEKTVSELFLFLNKKKTALEAKHAQYNDMLTLDNKWTEENDTTEVYQFATTGYAINLFFDAQSHDCGEDKVTTSIKGVLIAHKPDLIPETKIYDLNCVCLN